MVPNISAELLWLASEQSKVERSAALDELMHGLVRFLGEAQAATGEVPYRLANGRATRRQHYLCYQYNAFEFLAIARYAENTGDTQAVWMDVALAADTPIAPWAKSATSTGCWRAAGGRSRPC